MWVLLLCLVLMPFQISFDDFRKIVVRCNMLKDSEKDATGKLKIDEEYDL